MPALEQLVRPFQKPGALVSRRIVPVREEVEVTPAGKRWGQPGNLPVANQRETEDTGFAFEVKHVNDAKEIKANRRTTDIRIENEEDPEQFVVARRTDGLKFNYQKPPTLASFPVIGGSQPASNPNPLSGVKAVSGPSDYFAPANPTTAPTTGTPTQPIKIEGITLELDNSGEPGTPL